MSYDFSIVTPQRRERAVLTAPTGWGNKYKKLHNNTEISLLEEWVATAHNNFSNSFADANEQLYTERGAWGVITRDKVLRGGRKYISHAGTEWEREHKVTIPNIGYIIPTLDSAYDNNSGLWLPFQENTGIPHATDKSRRKAIGLVADYFEKKASLDKNVARKLARKWVLYFERPYRYETSMFVGRFFVPYRGDYDRFDVVAVGLSSLSGYDWVASRPVYKEPQFLTHVEAWPEEK